MKGGRTLSLRFGQDVFIPFLEQHTELTPEDEKLLAEIVATESDWNRKSGDKEQPEEIENTEEQPADHKIAEVEKAAKKQETEPPQERFEVTMTSDAFPDPKDTFAIWDNQRGDYYIDGDGMVLTYPTEEEAQKGLSEVRKAVTDKDIEDNSDFIGKELMIDNRRYLIESVGKISGDVSMRDITFQNSIQE